MIQGTLAFLILKAHCLNKDYPPMGIEPGPFQMLGPKERHLYQGSEVM